MSIENGMQGLASDFVANPAPFFSIGFTAGTTHSLTTVANQKVLVIVKGTTTGNSGDMTVDLKYNGVTKDTVTVRNGTSAYRSAFCLMYTEIPGAATQDITVVGSHTLENVKISVQKLLVG